jgi:hypothetical protein
VCFDPASRSHVHSGENALVKLEDGTAIFRGTETIRHTCDPCADFPQAVRHWYRGVSLPQSINDIEDKLNAAVGLQN